MLCSIWCKCKSPKSKSKGVTRSHRKHGSCTAWNAWLESSLYLRNLCALHNVTQTCTNNIGIICILKYIHFPSVSKQTYSCYCEIAKLNFVSEINGSYNMTTYHSEISCSSLSCEGGSVVLPVFKYENRARTCTAVSQPCLPAVAAFF